MSDVRKRILSPFTGCKKRKAWKDQRKIYAGKKKTKFSRDKQGIILQRAMVRIIFRQ